MPPVDEIMSAPEVAALALEHDREIVVRAVRRAIYDLRSQILSSDEPERLSESTSAARIAACVQSAVQAKFAVSLRWAVNATGIVLHTGLGRAMMPQAAVES